MGWDERLRCDTFVSHRGRGRSFQRGMKIGLQRMWLREEQSASLACSTATDSGLIGSLFAANGLNRVLFEENGFEGDGWVLQAGSRVDEGGFPRCCGFGCW